MSNTQIRRNAVMDAYVKPLIKVNSCLISPPWDFAVSLALRSEINSDLSASGKDGRSRRTWQARRRLRLL